jgi:hypothetical protein
VTPALEDRARSRVDGFDGGKIQRNCQGLATGTFDLLDDGICLLALVVIGDGDTGPFLAEQYRCRPADPPRASRYERYALLKTQIPGAPLPYLPVA